jgi:uncharacterized protein (DUF2235 family)
MSKYIVVSLDGTMDSLETTPTHIARMQDLLDGEAKTILVDTKHEEKEGWQVKYYYDSVNELNDKSPSLISYYDKGLGAPHVDKNGNFIQWSKQPEKFAEKLEDTFQEFGSAVFAEGINNKVARAYHFLASNYTPGDKVYCFGFSRGSYEALLLAQMIRTIGLINIQSPAFKNEYGDNLNMAIQDGFKCYKHQAQVFKRDFCLDGKELIHFMGLYEPVKGIVAHKEPDDHHIGNVAKHVRVALAIDEYRIEYPPIKVISDDEYDTQICWMPGAHGDLGGGYKNFNALSNISLRWMLNEAKHCQLPINQDRLTSWYPVNAFAEQHNSLADNIPFTEGTLQWKEISTHHERPIGVTIRGETIHPSALARFGQKVLMQDLNRKWVRTSYEPKNLATAVHKLNTPAHQSEAERGLLLFNKNHGFRVPEKLPLTEAEIKQDQAREKALMLAQAKRK